MKNTNKILANTGFMYVNLITSVIVSLYASRVVLNSLGVVDYGIYNVVGGVVLFFGFIYSSMAISLQRYFSYEWGRNNIAAVKRVFNAGLIIHICIAILIFILAETIGVWFMRAYLVIPLERADAAEWVFHFAVLSFMCTIITVPYQSVLFSRENMLAIAIVEITRTFLKLIIALLLLVTTYDKLKVYSSLYFVIVTALLVIYWFICRLKYPESRIMKVTDKSLFKELAGFAAWNLFGQTSIVGKIQGNAILLNIFFGPIVNAAFSITNQVNSQLAVFSNMIVTAANPQIVKNYSSGDHSSMFRLVFQSTKMCFFLMFTMCIPFFFEMDFILELWLKNVPEHTSTFCKLALINTLIDSMSSALLITASATGRIRFYQAVVGGIFLLNMPFTYIFFKFGYSSEIVFIIGIFLSLGALTARIIILRKLVNLNVSFFFLNVIARLMLLVLFTAIPLFILNETVDGEILRRVMNIFIAPIFATLVMYYIVLEGYERRNLIDMLKKIVNKSITKRG
ncbi:MAG: lipopolysaccharide biosynthesis protein [Proteobacteria bacterium]|nr:lipopolysaccharide biosynthesis protein [Pseudomonadota bacterium]